MSKEGSIHEVSFDITYDCSLDCLHCSNGDILKKQSLNFSRFKTIFNSIYENNPLKIIEFGGGEPFLHERFCDMVKYVSSSMEEVVIYTSGCISFCDKKKLYITKSCAAYLQKLGITQVNLTVHSIYPDIHNYISNLNDGLERVLCSIKNLNKADINVCVHVVVTRLNFDMLKETVQYLDSSFAISQFRLLRFVPQGRGAKNNSLFKLNDVQFNPQKLISSFPNQIRKKTTVAGFPNLFKCRPYPVISKQCAAGIEFVHVLPNGTIIPCPAFKGVQQDHHFSLSVEKFKKNDYDWNASNRNQCWGQEAIKQHRRAK